MNFGDSIEKRRGSLRKSDGLVPEKEFLPGLKDERPDWMVRALKRRSACGRIPSNKIHHGLSRLSGRYPDVGIEAPEFFKMIPLGMQE